MIQEKQKKNRKVLINASTYTEQKSKESTEVKGKKVVKPSTKVASSKVVSIKKKSSIKIPTSIDNISLEGYSTSNSSNDQKDEKIVLTGSRNNAYTKEQFDKNWDYLRSNVGNPMLVQMMGHDLTLQDHVITLYYKSTIEKEYIQKLGTEVLPQLRDLLKNDLLVLKGEKLKFKDTGPTLYTDSEKYEFLITEYPQLKLLKNKLGLDFI